MNLFDTAAILLVLAAVFTYINHDLVRLPSTIGRLIRRLAAEPLEG